MFARWDGGNVTEELTWFNDPPEWSVSGSTVRAVTGMKTDFWRRTFYGFTRDDGHFFFRRVRGDFTATVCLSGEYRERYDQCGLMVRVDAHNWMKAGVELSDGVRNVSTVITREYSDWSVVPLRRPGGPVTVSVTRHGEALRAQYLEGQYLEGQYLEGQHLAGQHLAEGGGWQLVRLGYMDLPESVDVGLMCCSPERAGFVAVFSDFAVSEPISRQLHQ